MKIAGTKTAEDWKELRVKLTKESTGKLWKSAVDDYLMERLGTRYLRPIECIEEISDLNGEGFAIVTIQCALIEFLAALRIGKKFRFVSKRCELREHEYSNSKELYIDFLKTQKPFSDWFDKDSADAFYANVRCALVHEARTKQGWKILATSSCAKGICEKTVYRLNLQAGITTYVEKYCENLKTNKSLQEAFIRKFDDLADDS